MTSEATTAARAEEDLSLGEDPFAGGADGQPLLGRKPASDTTFDPRSKDSAAISQDSAGTTRSSPSDPPIQGGRPEEEGGAEPWDEGAFRHVFGIASLAFYPEKVKALAVRVHPQKVKAAWCVGPVMHQATWMPVVYCAIACLVAGTTAVLSDCNEGEELRWPLWLWCPWLVIGLALLAAEYNILKHLSVPHYFKAKGWKAMPTEMLTYAIKKMNGGEAWKWWEDFTTGYGFCLWMTWGLFLSSVRLVSFFSANMFVGMVLGDTWLTAKDCSTGTVERVWKHSLQKSRWWLLPGETTLSSVFTCIFVAQIAHFLLGVLHSWPSHGQWYKDKGLKPDHKRHPSASDFYEQDLELDVIEHVPWTDPESVLTERQRQDGNRFSYVTLLGTEVTTSAAVEICAEACGQASIERTTELVVDSEDDKSVVIAITEAKPENNPDWCHIKAPIVKMRGMIQDALVVLRTVLSHVFLYGVCFSGLVLHAQVTYYHARCFNNVREAKECKDTSGLLIGVVAGFLTVFITLLKAMKVLIYIWSVLRVKGQYATWAEGTTCIRTDPADCGQKHREVLKLQGLLAVYAGFVLLAVLSFVLNFAWVATKFYMAEYVCEDHIWDVALPLTQGCVPIDHKALSG